MSADFVRGVTQEQEQSPSLLLRDTRGMGQRIIDFFKNSQAVAALFIGFGISVFFVPCAVDLIFICVLLGFWYAITRRKILPFRMPKRSKLHDYNDCYPGTSKPKLADGICFYGNNKADNRELWFTNEDMRTHTLIFGSTGSGKTEALLSIAFNALVQASGFIYVDGKGDNSLFSKVFSMARKMGREDDVLVINFMTGAKDIIGPQLTRLSNTMNPFCNGSSSMLSQLIISLMDASSNSSDADMWKGRAIVFVEAIMRVLVYMRDIGALLLDANTVRNYFELPKLESIICDKIFPRDGQDGVSLANVPQAILDGLTNYMVNLPGYDKSRKGKQVSQVLEQHGFITMQLTRVFGSLADTYGHILRTNLAEVDLKDVVLNRRILVVLLPAFEKSPDELSNLGKVIVASLKAMLAAGLGEDVEGDYKKIVESKPTNSPTPYICILDEYGYYAVPGFAVVPAQARSLGFALIFAGQDLPSFKKSSKEEALSIGANTNIKICMKLEDPTETWEFFQKTAGEAYVTKVERFQTRPDTLMNYYSDTRDASTERRLRIDILDLKDQVTGDAHIFFASKIIRARMFYANPPPTKKIRLNKFLKVELPSDKALIDGDVKVGKLSELLKSNRELFTSFKSSDTDIVFLISKIYSKNKLPNLINTSTNILISMHRLESADTPAEITLDESNARSINIFKRCNAQNMMTLLNQSEIKELAEPLLEYKALNTNLVTLQRLDGKSDADANNTTFEIINDMQSATNYPVATDRTLEYDNFDQNVSDIIDMIAAVESHKEKE